MEQRSHLSPRSIGININMLMISEVEIQGGEDIVVDGKLKLLVHAANHKLRVVDEVQRKDEDADPRVRHYVARGCESKAPR